ncbi:MAG: arginine deiminase family protein [Melioribacteraceae bacterium]
MKFSRAIVRLPGHSLIDGLSSAGLGLPDYDTALVQHAKYVEALKYCGLDVTTLPPDENYPDSTFIEDVALLTSRCAVITNPGAPTRNGEAENIGTALENFYSDIEKIRPPGTLEAGDLLAVENHYYVGLSERTNEEGARQLIEILNRYGMTGSIIKLKNVLHLKTGTAYLGNNNMVVCGEFVTHPEFLKFSRIEIDEDESYAANCIRINEYVIVPLGFPKTAEKIRGAGYQVIETDVSEFRKLDGGLSCLSLRF